MHSKVYTWYIFGIYLVFDHVCHIPGVYIEKKLWVCSVPVTYPDRHVISQAYAWYIPCLSGYVTGTEQTHEVFSMYNSGLRHTWSNTRYIVLYQVYTRYILCIFICHLCDNVYLFCLTYILLTYRKQGEREGRKVRLNLRTFSRVAPSCGMGGPLLFSTFFDKNKLHWVKRPHASHGNGGPG
jgi:hypothetical protein